MIVILAVIALIATPLIMGTITKAKKNAFVDTAYGIIKAGENYQVSRNFDSSGDISNLIIDDLVTDTTLAYKGTKPKAGKLLINQKGESAIAIWSGQFCVRKGLKDKKVTVNSSAKTSVACIESTFQIAEFESVKKVQTYTVPETGTYFVELWGAAGTSSYDGISGNGAYTSGYIQMNQGENYYIYVGSHEETYETGGWNSCYGLQAGGGATDIRLTSGNWYDFNSLKSRIMVAAGGGAGERVVGGAGGGLKGLDGEGEYVEATKSATGGTQTSGGLKGFGYEPGKANNGENGYFGRGGSGCVGCSDIGPGGGGGSSFISGYTGCDAITSNSTESNIIHTGQPNHYSGKVFTNPVMIDGNHSMPNPRGIGNIKGNAENGYAKITLVSVN